MAYLEPCQKFVMGLYAKKVFAIIFAKSYITDVRQGPKYITERC